MLSSSPFFNCSLFGSRYEAKLDNNNGVSDLYIPFHLILCELTSCSFLLLLASLKFALQQLVASFIRSANGRWRIPIRHYFFKDNTISHRCHTWCKCNTKITRKSRRHYITILLLIFLLLFNGAFKNIEIN